MQVLTQFKTFCVCVFLFFFAFFLGGGCESSGFATSNRIGHDRTAPMSSPIWIYAIIRK